MESNTSWTVKIKVYTLLCASEEPLQYVANQNIHVAWHLYILSHNKTIDLPFDLVCRTTSLWCLRHTIFAYDKLMHSCDVKTMIYHFLNMVVTSKLLYIVFEHGWETVFYHMYTVKVYYKYIYIYYTYIYITTKTQVLITLSKAIEQFCWKSHLILWKSDTRKSNV